MLAEPVGKVAGGAEVEEDFVTTSTANQFDNSIGHANGEKGSGAGCLKAGNSRIQVRAKRMGSNAEHCHEKVGGDVKGLLCGVKESKDGGLWVSCVEKYVADASSQRLDQATMRIGCGGEPYFFAGDLVLLLSKEKCNAGGAHVVL